MTVPSLFRVALLPNPSDAIIATRSVEQVRTAAERLGVTIQPIERQRPSTIRVERARSGVAYEGIPIACDVARVQSTAQPLSGAVQFERNV
jgi:hypothetical protein